jgi:predicted  nucleic acid-binding Zn-ribbon protein
MATNKQISKCSEEFVDLTSRLEMLKEKKQLLQDSLADVIQQIDEAQTAIVTAKADLKAMLEE